MSATSHVLEIRLLGSLQIGGYSSDDIGADKVTARDRAGIPLIPGSAIRGAVRIEFERLLRARGARLGLDERAFDPTSAVALTGLDAEEGLQDAAARIFGQPTVKGMPSSPGFPQSSAGLLRFRNATLVTEDGNGRGAPTALQHSVSIDRATSAARSEFLRSSLQVLPGSSALFRGGVEGISRLSEVEARFLRAAVRAVRRIGGGRGHGGGEVVMRLIERTHRAVVEPGSGEGGDAPSTIAVEAELLEPTRVGSDIAERNHRASLEYIPGSTVRGALGTALVLRGLHEGGDSLRALFDQARIGPLFPICARDRARAAEVAPFTLLQSRSEDAGGRRALADVLLIEMLLERLRRTGCPVQWEPPPEFSSGSRPAPAFPFAAPIVMRTMTRTAIDRYTGAARDAFLHSVDAMESGSVFVGELRRLPAELAQLLLKLHSSEVTFGEGTGRGQGLARVEIRRSLSDPVATALVRVEAFCARYEALREIVRAQLDIELAPSVPVPILIETPLIEGSGVSLRREDGEFLGRPISFRRVRSTRVGFYDQIASRRTHAVPAAAPGSVLVVEAATEDWRTDVERLARLGFDGVGSHTERGFGRFVVCSGFHGVQMETPT